MALHEQTTKDLKRQVADGSLSPKKEARGRGSSAPPPYRADP
jgi:hypothetical protein